jgi:hypothetical protein
MMPAMGSLIRSIRPTAETRSALAALLAFCALLLPALLPYGPTPIGQAGQFLAPHPHVGIHAATPHDHTGGSPQLPDAAKVIAPAILAILPGFVLPRAPAARVDTVAPALVAVALPQAFSLAHPRAPPAAA